MQINDDYFPLRIPLVAPELEEITRWTSGEKDDQMFEATLNAAYFLKESGFKEALMIVFEDQFGGTIADVSLTRDMAIESLEKAEAYFAEVESFDKAIQARDLGIWFRNNC
jgi:hypothetical protein